MILQGYSTSATQKLLQALNDAVEESNAKQTELDIAQAELADADAALEILGVEVDE